MSVQVRSYIENNAGRRGVEKSKNSKRVFDRQMAICTTTVYSDTYVFTLFLYFLDLP